MYTERRSEITMEDKEKLKRQVSWEWLYVAEVEKIERRLKLVSIKRENEDVLDEEVPIASKKH